LEGECRVKDIVLLKINYPKGLFLGTLLALSFVGLLLLKYFIKLRAFAFYSRLEASQAEEATHVFATGHEGSQEISKVKEIAYG
jgi:hypothetical protein